MKEQIFMEYLKSQKEISDSDKKLLMLMLEFWFKIGDIDKNTYNNLIEKLDYKESYNIEGLIKNALYNRHNNKYFNSFVLRSIIKSLISDKEKRELYLNQIG